MMAAVQLRAIRAPLPAAELDSCIKLAAIACQVPLVMLTFPSKDGDWCGALLGMGDMLYMGNGARITRIHGPFVSDEEVEEIVNHLKSFGPPSYMSGVVEGPEDDAASDIDLVLGLGSGDSSDDALYDQAVAIVAKDRKCSTSYIQRKLGIGYNKAARLVEQMEEEGVVTSANHVGKREILIPEA